MNLWVNTLEAFPVINDVNNWEHKYSHSTMLVKQAKKTKGNGHNPFQNKQ